MLTPRQEIARERRRQIQVRKAFEAGLGVARANAADSVAFYLACADYLDWSMDRLHRQDQRIHDLLAQRIPAAETQAHERLAVLDERQGRSRALVGNFRRVADALRRSGQGGLADFEKGAHEFTEAFTALLQPRKNPFHLHTDRLFTDADWADIAGVTPLSLEDEQRLFAAVRRAAPPGADPEGFTAEHLPG